MSKDSNNLKYKQVTIKLDEFKELDGDAQKEELTKALDKMWGGTVKVEPGYINKCIKLVMSKIDDEIHLPKRLLVEKNGKELLFSYKEHRNTAFFFILFGALLLVGLFSATYSGLVLFRRSQINIDIDGDGIADINIDLNFDDDPDVNIDLNKDNKPDLNVDYKGNRVVIFNKDTNGDQIPDSNFINDATNGQACSLNCDSNGNGWPNYNIDLDGDGTADVDIDTDGDGVPDLNIDLNGDGIPDINVDNNGDGTCDANCSNNGNTPGIIESGPSTVTGDQTNNLISVHLRVVYQDDGEINMNGMYPDDQEGVTITRPTKAFTVTNDSDFTAAYNLSWLVNTNTYTTNHFQYKITADHGGYNQDYQTVPWQNTLIKRYVLILPHTTQNYTVTFNLLGINEPQNEDQDQTFIGYIKVGD